MSALSESLRVYKLACQLKKSQLNRYFMAKLEEFYLNNDNDGNKTLKAAPNLGLQGGKDTVAEIKTWVFNEDLQIVVKDNGQVLQSDSTKKYVWLGKKYTGKPSPHIAPCNLGSRARPCSPDETPLATLFTAIENCYQQLTPAVLMTIGAQLLSMHYEQIMSVAHQVPAAVLYGKIQCGKSRAQECAASLLGIRDSGIIRQTTSDLVFADMSCRSSLGFALDDPSSNVVLSDKILNHFEGKQVISSCKQYKPTCTFSASVNFPCLTKLASMDRYVIVFPT